MKTCIKKIVSLTLGLALILSLCIPKPIMKEAQAKPIVKNAYKYVALGDSVSYGMSATKTKKSYTSLFYQYLKSIKEYQGVPFRNLSKPGDTSHDLLTKISDEKKAMAAIKNADVITINIGGNNLLGPVIQTIGALFGVDPLDPDFEAKLVEAMESNPDELNRLLDDEDDFTIALRNELVNGVVAFHTDFPEIIRQINMLAPNAEIYVNTIYNPFDESDPFYDVVDYFIQQINFSIKAPSVVYNVVDVYEEFSNYEGNKTLVDFNIATGSVDPHPTDAGHQLIFEAHVEAYED